MLQLAWSLGKNLSVLGPIAVFAVEIIRSEARRSVQQFGVEAPL